MLPDIEVYRAANQLFNAFGDNALTETTIRADLAEKAGDPESAALWRQIGERERMTLRFRKPSNW